VLARTPVVAQVAERAIDVVVPALPEPARS